MISIADKSRDRSIAEGRGFGKGEGIDINSKARHEVNNILWRDRRRMDIHIRVCEYRGGGIV